MLEWLVSDTGSLGTGISCQSPDNADRTTQARIRWPLDPTRLAKASELVRERHLSLREVTKVLAEPALGNLGEKCPGVVLVSFSALG